MATTETKPKSPFRLRVAPMPEHPCEHGAVKIALDVQQPDGTTKTLGRVLVFDGVVTMDLQRLGVTVDSMCTGAAKAISAGWMEAAA